MASKNNSVPIQQLVQNILQHSNARKTIAQYNSKGQTYALSPNFVIQEKEITIEQILSSETYKKIEEKYLELVKLVQQLFFFVNKLYYEKGTDDFYEILQRKAEEPKYINISPTELIDATQQLISLLVKNLQKASERVQEYKISKYYSENADPNQIDYFFVLQQSENEMRKQIRENQQLLGIIQNLELKVTHYDKQIDLLQNYTTQSLEKMKQECQQAIDIQRNRETQVDLQNVEIKHKSQQILQLEQKLISVPILETKIQSLGKFFTKEVVRQKNESDFRFEFFQKKHKEEINITKETFQGKVNQLQQSLKRIQNLKQKKIEEFNSQLSSIQRQKEQEVDLYMSIAKSKQNEAQDIAQQRKLQNIKFRLKSSCHQAKSKSVSQL